MSASIQVSFDKDITHYTLLLEIESRSLLLQRQYVQIQSTSWSFEKERERKKVNAVEVAAIHTILRKYHETDDNNDNGDLPLESFFPQHYLQHVTTSRVTG